MDTMSAGQANAEVLYNRAMETLEWAQVYGRRQSTSTGLTWGYYGGRWSGFSISAGTLSLTNNATNYLVVARSTGVHSTSTSATNWNDTTNYARVYQVTTASSVVTAVQDHRAGGLYGGGGGGVGGAPTGAGYARYLAASLEPEAIEAVQKGAFSYAINGSTTKLLIASFGTRLGSAGRMEQRNPQRFLPIRGATITGLGSDSTAIIIDPTAATYTDAWSTYYDRMQALAESTTQNLAFTATSQRKPFLPGAYGAIITQVTCFDFAWLALRPLGGTTYGINLWDEISDSTTQRVGDSLSMPIHKKCAGTIDSSSTGSSPLGSVSYVLLPSTWSTIADPVSSSYSFRDDFMGASIDTGVWTRTQSTGGNVEIDTNYQWCTLTGNSSWGANGLRKTTTQARSNGRKLVIDVYVPVGAASVGAFMVGWNGGGGIGVADFAHAVNFASANVINVYEDNNARGTVGSGYTEGAIYRIRITQGTASATYEIQGGPEYAALGGGSWTDITPGGTSSTTTPLTPAASAFAASGYISDFRVFT